MVKVFISVGMSGREERDVLRDIDRVGRKAWDMFGEDVGIYDNYYCDMPDDAGRLWCLGEAIKILGNCDICYFVKDWQNYKGCRAEYEICKLYGIEIIDET